MGRALETVCGPVDGSQIGKTLVHEHFVFGFPGFQADSTLGPYDPDEALRVGVETANRAKRHGVAFSLVSTITEEMRMDDIQKTTKNEVARLKYEKGVLLEVEGK